MSKYHYCHWAHDWERQPTELPPAPPPIATTDMPEASDKPRRGDRSVLREVVDKMNSQQKARA